MGHWSKLFKLFGVIPFAVTAATVLFMEPGGVNNTFLKKKKRKLNICLIIIKVKNILFGVYLRIDLFMHLIN